MKKKINKFFVFIIIFLIFLSPSVFCASKQINLVNGFDKDTNSLRWTGIGSNVSQAVILAIDGLERCVEKEIHNRCDRIGTKYGSEDFDIFTNGINDNMPSIKREMVRKSKCAEKYETESGEYVVSYKLDSNSFESIMDKYILKFNGSSDDMNVYTQRIQSINRFFKNKFSDSQIISVRVK